MNTEFTIELNGLHTNVYMQTGFFNHMDMSFPLHKHPMLEMHILLSGSAVLRYDTEDIILQESDVFCIPANILHSYQTFDKGAKRITFFINSENLTMSTNKITFSKSILSLLCKEIEEYVLTAKDSKLKSLLSYICSDFFDIEVQNTMRPITNRELIIEDFFSKKFTSNARIDDLAKELMLSCKQTEREVKRITGNTFTAEIAKRKMNAAIILLQTTDLPITKISELVGYSSYSGFYKAYKRKFYNSQIKV